ncbi:hypothetical protein B4077_0858 [Bacillus cereus]|uniref:Uncharacterized protein n=1 Tax=Bacillus cereus TaxID=1396 RepID=A0A0G8EYP5_BACCE|nr:hypothetical protein B4077_0858 [Bacillus cereus]
MTVTFASIANPTSTKPATTMDKICFYFFFISYCHPFS